MPRSWPLVLFVLVAALIFARTPATAAAETISGTVTGPSNQALEGVCVVAWDPADNSIPNGVRAFTGPGTDASGAYTLSLPAGAASYKVSFQTGGNFGCGTAATQVVTEYYNDQPDHASAALVQVAAGGTTPNINAQLAFPPAPTTGTIAGKTTTTQGGGLENVCVAVLDPNDATGQTIVAGGITNATGDYAFAGLAPGSYKVVFDTDSPLCPVTTTRIFTEFFDNRASFALADLVQVTAGNTTTANAAVDSKPVAVNDSPTVTEDQPTDIAVLSNDVDADNPDVIEIATVSDPGNGVTAIKQGTPDQITYTPDPGYCNNPGGTADTFTYTVNGGDSATVSVTVTCVIAENDSANAQEDGPAVTVNVRDNDLDSAGVETTQTITMVTQGTKGAVVITAGDTVTYDPTDDNSCGADSFTYELQGGSIATVSVAIACENDPTDAMDDPLTVQEDAAATTVDVLANDNDPDTKATVASVTNPPNGTATVPAGGANVSYAPDANFCGADSFQYTLSDGDTATVNVTVTPCPDDPPTAVNDSGKVSPAAPQVTIDVLANDTDVDGGPKSIDTWTQPQNGSVDSGQGGFTYRQRTGYCGPDSFTYKLFPGASTGTVSITAENCPVPGDPDPDPEDPDDPDPQNPNPNGDDPPKAANDTLTIPQGVGETTFNPLANDTDSDGGPKRVIAVQAGKGAVAIIFNGVNLTYTAPADFCGTDTFTYVLNGGSRATVTVVVKCIGPPTEITKAPKKTITTKKKKAKVKVRFTSAYRGATFRCKLDTGKWRRCKSPKTFRLKPGRHTIRVAAVDKAGNPDSTPAKVQVKVVREKPRRKKKR